jgi:hypothetical protein
VDWKKIREQRDIHRHKDEYLYTRNIYLFLLRDAKIKTTFTNIKIVILRELSSVEASGDGAKWAEVQRHGAGPQQAAPQPPGTEHQ